MLGSSALPIHGADCSNRRMLSGAELGAALKSAMDAKKVKQPAVAAAFGVAQSSVSEWISYGRIAKKHIPKLLDFFADVVGPDHWGLPFTREEYELVMAFRDLHQASRRELLVNVKRAAMQQVEARERGADLLTVPSGLGELHPSDPKRRQTRRG